jgi:ADP-heptose:LPS heptosyltransferase
MEKGLMSENNSTKSVRLKISRYTSAILFRLFDLDLKLKRAKEKQAKRFVTAWIRGLGDVSMILSEAVKYIKSEIPDAEITLMVRPGLDEVAKWIGGLNEIITIDDWDREQTIGSIWGLAYPTPWQIKKMVDRLNLGKSFDLILPYPLGKWWFRNAYRLRPSLKWTAHEAQCGRFIIDRLFAKKDKFVVTINSSTGTESYYQYNRDWGYQNFKTLISSILESISEARVILVDKDRTGEYPANERLFDARGRFSISESISIIANSDLFICLDTGPPNLVYFMEGVSLNIIALLGQSHSFFKYDNPPASKNILMKKIYGRDHLIENISVETVLQEVLKFYETQ